MKTITMKDAYHNRLTIERFDRKPYNTASQKTPCYRVSLYSPDGFNYYRACYQNLEDAHTAIKAFSGGTFKAA